MKGADRILKPEQAAATHAEWIARDFARRDYSALSRGDVAALSELLEPVEVKAGQRILSPGEPADTAYIVERGEVELSVRRGGRRVLVSIQRDCGVFGDVPLLCELPFPFVAVARSDTTLLKLDRSGLIDLLASHPSVALRWLVNVVMRLERAHRRVVELSLGDLRSRVIALMANELADETDGSRIHLTQAQMAAMLGTTRQSVNRVLRQLAKDELVRQWYGEIQVEDPDRVMALAGATRRARFDAESPVSTPGSA